MTSRAIRIAAPVFFTVPAGTVAQMCGKCAATVYPIEAASSKQKQMAIDCQVLGGRAPTAMAAGSGVSHWIYCTGPARDRATRRREHSPL